MRKLLAGLIIFMVIVGIGNAPGPWADTVETLASKTADVFRGWGEFVADVAD